MYYYIKCRHAEYKRHTPTPLLPGTCAETCLLESLGRSDADLAVYQAMYLDHQPSGFSRTMRLVYSEYGSIHRSDPICGTQAMPIKFQVPKIPCIKAIAGSAGQVVQAVVLGPLDG